MWFDKFGSAEISWLLPVTAQLLVFHRCVAVDVRSGFFLNKTRVIRSYLPT